MGYDERPTVGGEQPPPSGPRRIPALPVAAAILAVVAVVAVGMVVVPTAPEQPRLPQVPAPETTLPAPAPQAQAPGYTDTLLILAGSPVSQEKLLVAWPAVDPEPEVEPLGWLPVAAFDAAGSHVAAVRRPAPDRPLMLVSGQRGAALEPVAGPVSGFAWHPDQPGRLAWTAELGARELGLAVGDLDSGERRHVASLFGRKVRLWGNWGFAVTVPGREYRVRLRDPRGRPIGEVEGLPLGTLPATGEPVFIRPPSPGEPAIPFALDPYTGQRRPLTWFEPDHYPQRIVPGPEGRMAVHLNRGGLLRGVESSLVRVVEADGSTVAEVTSTHRVAASAWSSDERYLAVSLDAPPDEIRVAILDVGSGEVVEVALALGLDGAGFVQDLRSVPG